MPLKSLLAIFLKALKTTLVILLYTQTVMLTTLY